MKRSTQIALLLMGATGVGAAGFAMMRGGDCATPAPGSAVSGAPSPGCSTGRSSGSGGHGGGSWRSSSFSGSGGDSGASHSGSGGSGGSAGRGGFGGTGSAHASGS
jgi:hypothetical protein